MFSLFVSMAFAQVPERFDIAGFYVGRNFEAQYCANDSDTEQPRMTWLKFDGKKVTVGWQESNCTIQELLMTFPHKNWDAVKNSLKEEYPNLKCIKSDLSNQPPEKCLDLDQQGTVLAMVHNNKKVDHDDYVALIPKEEWQKLMEKK